ncbi:mitochondrial fission ELM1 family protein [Solilutibacter silvestris]|uniref:Putative nucleoside-diphosphate-sugar epimerase n=1 Tax=Solilutibacter silvestris TaxID=1645665 RepID=A0A2K1Q0D4_9GAMM|nr:mitochondrial fission ELM1 family protein [Lysobacter silvestris]PNS08499.1 putative nucleoside-diphosphate-sugar epimerase [Lysobacter silvestris]
MTVLAMSDGRAGNVRQAQALADALNGQEAPHLRLDPATPWRWLAPRRLPAAGHGLGDGFAALLRNPPAIAVGCGRQAALATRVLRDVGTRTVQILDPRIDPRHWDLLVVPEHDALRGPNVLTLLGSLNPIDDAWLAEVRANQPRPPAWGGGALTAVMIGGPTSAVAMDTPDVAAFVRELVDEASAAGNGLVITTSGRTPRDWLPALRDAVARSSATLWSGDGDGPNPHAAMLAYADRIVCTPDSVNMLSEACATGASVEWLPFAVRGRIAAFLAALAARRRARPLGAAMVLDTTPLRETARIAGEVRRRLRELR